MLFIGLGGPEKPMGWASMKSLPSPAHGLEPTAQQLRPLLLYSRADLPSDQKTLGDPDSGSFVPRLGRDALVKVVGGRHFEYRDLLRVAYLAGCR